MIATVEAVTLDPESTLVAGIRARAGEAYRALLQQYGQRMRMVARRFLHSDEDSADAVQDALLSAYQSIDTFVGGSRLWTWLCRILINVCLTKLRYRSRRPAVSLEDAYASFEGTDGFALPACTRTEPVHLQASRAEIRERVRGCIAQLPERYRQVLVLRDIEELDTQETAQRLHLSPGAVKTRLHRARHSLRVLLAPLVEAAEPGQAAPGTASKAIL
jgi:RNA polymerase sigma-70 factor, ECF subfamily